MTKRTLREFRAPTSYNYISLTIEVNGTGSGKVRLINTFANSYDDWQFAGRHWWRKTMLEAVQAGIARFEAEVEQYHRAVLDAELASEIADAAVDIATL